METKINAFELFELWTWERCHAKLSSTLGKFWRNVSSEFQDINGALMQRLLLCGFNTQDIKREMVRTWQTFMSAVERLTCQQTLELLFLNSLYVKCFCTSWSILFTALYKSVTSKLSLLYISTGCWKVFSCCAREIFLTEEPRVILFWTFLPALRCRTRPFSLKRLLKQHVGKYSKKAAATHHLLQIDRCKTSNA